MKRGLEIGVHQPKARVFGTLEFVIDDLFLFIMAPGWPGGTGGC